MFRSLGRGVLTILAVLLAGFQGPGGEPEGQAASQRSETYLNIGCAVVGVLVVLGVGYYIWALFHMGN